MMMANIPEETIVCVYILCDVIISILFQGPAYGIVASVIISLSYAFFVTAPRNSFHSLTPYILLTTSILLVISMIISSITNKVKEGEIQARRREEESNVLYHLTRDLAGVSTVRQVILLTLKNIAEVFHTNCRMILFDENGKPEKTFTLLEGQDINENMPTNPNRDFSEYKTRPKAGYYVNTQQYEWPVYGQNQQILGAVAIPYEVAYNLPELDVRVLNTMIEAVGIVLDKQILLRKQEQARIEIDQERYRTNLLRSISHDLRTPLAGISGTAEVLMNMLPKDSREYVLAGNIRKETSWLYNLVQNVLSLTRLQNGTLKLKKEVMVVEDVVESAVDTIKYRLPDREIVTHYPDEVLAAAMDSSLIKQVLINLIDNANKYSPKDQPIELTVQSNENGSRVCVSVTDHGQGLNEEAKRKVFNMFYTTKASDPEASRGFGLGLPICDSIMKAHQGSITADNRNDGYKGACFTICLPAFTAD